MSKATVKAWHFSDGNMNHDMRHIQIVPGLELSVDPDRVELCTYGLHGCTSPLDALKYGNGAFISYNEYSGLLLHGDDKLVSSNRKTIACADASRVLHEFAILCAEDALALIESPDPRSIEALRVKRLWLDGKATDEELKIARTEAYAAAEEAYAAARAAADAAARAAAYAAADAEAYAAARAAAREKQSTRLEAILFDLLDIDSGQE